MEENKNIPENIFEVPPLINPPAVENTTPPPETVLPEQGKDRVSPSHGAEELMLHIEEVY